MKSYINRASSAQKARDQMVKKKSAAAETVGTEIKFESPEVNETYVKLKPLTDEQASKGYYLSLTPGEKVEGILKGTRLSTGKYPGRLEYVIEPLTGGKPLVIANAGNLKAAIERKSIGIGDALQIVYRGKQKATSGKFAGTEMHNFSVFGEAE